MCYRPAFFCVALIHLATLAALAQRTEQPSLELYVYNHAGVSENVMAEAEDQAARIFQRSGLRTTWTNCTAGTANGTNCSGLPGPDVVILQVVHDTNKLKDDVFGAAFVGRDGRGQHTDIYYDRVNDLHRDGNIPIPSVLGHVIAHEIGHLLLGLNSHSNSGIMCPYWGAQELAAAERGRLLFSREQSKIIRERLINVSAGTPTYARSLQMNPVEQGVQALR